MNRREYNFYLYCRSIPLSNYYETIRKRCRNIRSDHAIKTYQRIADMVWAERGGENAEVEA